MPTKSCRWICRICGASHKTRAAAVKCEEKHVRADKFEITDVKYKASSKDLFPERLVLRLKLPEGGSTAVASYERMVEDGRYVDVLAQDDDS